MFNKKSKKIKATEQYTKKKTYKENVTIPITQHYLSFALIENSCFKILKKASKNEKENLFSIPQFVLSYTYTAIQTLILHTRA